MIGSAKEKSVVDKTELVTFMLDSLNLFTAHWKLKGKGEGKQAGSKTPRKQLPADATVYTREEGLTVQLCGDNEVVGK